MARRSIRRSASDEPDEERTRSRYDDEEEETTHRSRRASRDEDEDEEPRRGRSRRTSRDEDEDEEPRRRVRGSRRNRDEEDEDEEPRRGRSSRRGERDDEKPRERLKSKTVGRGWGAVSNLKTGDYVKRWDVPERPALIKFLEPEPFTVYSEHFIEDLPKGTKKSYICLGKDECPLCDDLGDVPNGYAGFNILDLTDPENPKNAFLRASTGLAKDIEVYANEKRSKPINRYDVYFTLFRKRQSGARYKLEFVPAREVEEYFDLVPFEEDELEEYQKDLITEEQVVYVDSRKQLKEVVALLDDEYVD